MDQSQHSSHKPTDMDGPSEATLTDPGVLALYMEGLISRAEADILTIIVGFISDHSRRRDMSELDPQRQSSRAEQEAIDLVSGLLREHPLPEPPLAPQPEGIYPFDDPEAATLHCVAFIRDGHIIPIFDLEDAPPPSTPGEKMHYMAGAARTIIEGLMDALLFWEERRRQEQQNDEEEDGGACV